MKYYTSTTEFNCGIDLHARQMYVCLMDRQGKKLVHTNVKDNDFAYFLKLIEPYKHSLTVCCECMFGWYWLADACQAAGLNFRPGPRALRQGHPRRQKQERPSRLRKARAPAPLQSHSPGLRLPDSAAAAARALTPTHLLRLASRPTAGPHPLPSTGPQPRPSQAEPLDPRPLGRTASQSRRGSSAPTGLEQ